MKIQIRKGVFETNSSSTHALCIAKKYDKKHIPEVINFGVLNNQEFWTAKENYQYRADKLFAGIIGKYEYDCAKAFARLGKLIELLKVVNIPYTFNLTEDYIENQLPYIEESLWVDIVLENEHNLMCFLFNDHSDFHEIDCDEVYREGGLETIFDKNKVDIYAEHKDTLERI